MPRTALVTGAGQGVGAGIAGALARAGHRVVVSDRTEEAAAPVSDALAAEGGDVVVAALDVRRKEDFERASDRHGPIEILVNNAALTRAQPFDEVTADDWSAVIDVNLRGVLFGCQILAPRMAELGWGRIVNLSSLAGQRGGPQVQSVQYAVSKTGIIGLTRYVAQEYAGQGVTVNAVAPGPILTPQTALAPEERLAAVQASIPAGRLGDVDEVGAAVEYLVGERSGFVTGAVLDVNGGALMR